MFDWLRGSGQHAPAFAESLEPSEVPAPPAHDEVDTSDRARALAQLAAILNDDREYAGPFPLGGPAAGGTGGATNGQYYMENPFDTESEYALITVSFTGAATAVLSQNATLASYGGTSTYNTDPSPSVRGIPVASGGANTFPGFDIWFPLPGRERLYWVVAGAGAAVCVLAFRRRLNPSGTVAQF